MQNQSMAVHQRPEIVRPVGRMDAVMVEAYSMYKPEHVERIDVVLGQE